MVGRVSSQLISHNNVYYIYEWERDNHITVGPSMRFLMSLWKRLKDGEKVRNSSIEEKRKILSKVKIQIQKELKKTNFDTSIVDNVIQNDMKFASLDINKQPKKVVKKWLTFFSIYTLLNFKSF